MIGPAVRFWLLVISAVGAISATLLLVVSAFLPGAIFGEEDTIAYIVSVFVGLVSLGLLVWSLSTDAGAVSNDRPGAR